MSKLSMKFNIDLGNTSVASKIIDASVMPLLYQAVRSIGQQLSLNWKMGVMTSAHLSPEEKDKYVQSIGVYPVSDLEVVVSSDYKYASDIETGRAPRDLKENIAKSDKARISKKGVKYLIIPFRHGNPKANNNPMSTDVYALAKAMASSSVVGMGSRMNAHGSSVPQRIYQWGDSLPAGLTNKLNPSHKSDPTAGMVRMDTSSGKSKSSAYLTFRVMSEKSKGWIVPGKAGLNIVKTVVDDLQPKAEEAIKEAVKLTFSMS